MFANSFTTYPNEHNQMLTKTLSLFNNLIVQERLSKETERKRDLQFLFSGNVRSF